MSKCYDNPDYDDLGSDIQNAWEQHKPKQHVELINDNIEEFDKAIELFKQETLEEAAEREASLFYEKGSLDFNKYRQVFIEGAKWQQEQIGKSEFIQKLRATLSDAEARRLIFEQFKKK